MWYCCFGCTWVYLELPSVVRLHRCHPNWNLWSLTTSLRLYKMGKLDPSPDGNYCRILWRLKAKAHGQRESVLQSESQSFESIGRFIHDSCARLVNSWNETQVYVLLIISLDKLTNRSSVQHRCQMATATFVIHVWLCSFLLPNAPSE